MFLLTTSKSLKQPVGLPLIHLWKNLSTFRLQCLLYGDKTDRIFLIDTPDNTAIAEIRETIKIKTQPLLDKFAAHELDIWKVHLPLHTDDPTLKILKDNPNADIEAELKGVKLTDSMSTIGDNWKGSPPERCLHVIVKPPCLAYVAPKPVLKTSGLAWDHQVSSTLLQTLRNGIRNHYANYKAGDIDKSTMPLYLFLSGAGTGKSRNASEFHRTAVKCLGDEDAELKKKLQNAWVFHVSLENGSGIRVNELDPFNAIGSRMLAQLLPGEDLTDITINYKETDPLHILRLVAKYEKQELEKATIIVVVDAMQTLMDSYEDGLKADSPFYKTLTAIGDLAHKGAFLLPCCTATSPRPIELALKRSSRNRINLPVASLEPPTIFRDGITKSVFQMDDSAMKILVGDCGGHGRAIEILSQLTEGLDLKKCDVGDLMRKLRDRLIERYISALPNINDAKAIAQAVLVHQRLTTDSFIPNTTKRPDEVVEPGLIRYENLGAYGYLHAPYIWLWVMAERTDGESLLPGWRFDDYDNLLAKEDRTLPSNCSWETFEKFNAKFRSMKSFALREGQPTKISEIHFGARLNGDIDFVNHRLDAAYAVNQIDTRTTEMNSVKWIINSTEEPIDIRQHKLVIINAKSAEFGDVFHSLDAPSPANEIQQYKLYSGDTVVRQENYDYEREKAASKQDFFILFTTQEKPCDINLPINSGIVDRQNWQNYFGPFTGRAFVYGVEGTPNINKASFTTLQLVNGVSSVRAKKILEKRPFSSVEDAEQKTNIPRKILEQFKF